MSHFYLSAMKQRLFSWYVATERLQILVTKQRWPLLLNLLHAWRVFKVSPSWLLRHFMRPQWFYLQYSRYRNDRKARFWCILVVVVQQSSTVFWETVGKISETISVFRNALKTLHGLNIQCRVALLRNLPEMSGISVLKFVSGNNF